MSGAVALDHVAEFFCVAGSLVLLALVLGSGLIVLIVEMERSRLRVRQGRRTRHRHDPSRGGTATAGRI